MRTAEHKKRHQGQGAHARAPEQPRHERLETAAARAVASTVREIMIGSPVNRRARHPIKGECSATETPSLRPLLHARRPLGGPPRLELPGFQGGLRLSFLLSGGHVDFWFLDSWTPFRPARREPAPSVVLPLARAVAMARYCGGSRAWASADAAARLACRWARERWPRSGRDPASSCPFDPTEGRSWPRAGRSDGPPGGRTPK